MSPHSAPRGPVERGFVFTPAPGPEQLAASVGGPGRKPENFCLIFGIPSWLMALRDRSGQSLAAFGQAVRGRSDPSLLKVIGTCRGLNSLPPPTLPLFPLCLLGCSRM